VPHPFARGWRRMGASLCSVPEGLGALFFTPPTAEAMGYHLPRPRRSFGGCVSRFLLFTLKLPNCLLDNYPWIWEPRKRSGWPKPAPFKFLYGSIMRRPVRPLALEPGAAITGPIAIEGATAIGAAPGLAVGPTPATAFGRTPVVALGFTPATALGLTLVTALGLTPTTLGLAAALGLTLVTALGLAPTALGLTLVLWARPTHVNRPSSIPQIITFFIHSPPCLFRVPGFLLLTLATARRSGPSGKFLPRFTPGL